MFLYKPVSAAKQSLCIFVFQVYFDEDRYEIDDLCKKDFFYKVFHDMVSHESGMFILNDTETLAWFPSKVNITILTHRK